MQITAEQLQAIINDITQTTENEFNNKVIPFIKEVYGRVILPEMAKQLFDSDGSFDGREGWQPNAPSTIKRKKSNKPNVDTGNLKEFMTTPDNLVSNDWLDKLSTPNGSIDGYKYADNLRKFSDLGETEMDADYIANRLQDLLLEQFSNG